MKDGVFFIGISHILKFLHCATRGNVWRGCVGKVLFLVCLATFPIKSQALCVGVPGAVGNTFTTTGPTAFLFNLSNLAADDHTPLTPWYITTIPQFVQCKADLSGYYYYRYSANTPMNTDMYQAYYENGYPWSIVYSTGRGGDTSGLGISQGISAKGDRFVNVPIGQIGAPTYLGMDGKVYLNAGDVLSLPLYFQHRLFKVVTPKVTTIKPGTYTITYNYPNATTYVSIAFTDPQGATNAVSGAVLIQSHTITVNSKTCSVLSPSLSVNLPAMNINNLPSVGSTSSPTPFTISINCATSTNVYMTFTDLNNPVQTTSVLSAAPGSTSSGVGLQLRLNGNQTVSFGPDSNVPGTTNQFLALSNAINANNLSFTASYIRTGVVSPGTLNAAATFTMSYQ